MPNDEARRPVTPQELRYAAGLLETYEHYALAQKLNAAAGQLERNAVPQMEGQLEHGRNCPALNPCREDECRCGLKYRVHLQTEQAMSAAWRKRAEEAEQKLERNAEVMMAISAGLNLLADESFGYMTKAWEGRERIADALKRAKC